MIAEATTFLHCDDLISLLTRNHGFANEKIPSGKLTYLLNMAIEIVSFPIRNCVIFVHSFWYVYQAG